MNQIFSLKVDSVLGHSFIYHEYRGNFAKARQITVEQLNEARKNGETSALCATISGRGPSVAGRIKGSHRMFRPNRKACSR